MMRVKLPYLEGETARRQDIAQSYRARINNPFVKLPSVENESAHVWHLFVVRCNVRRQAAAVVVGARYPDADPPTPSPHKQQAYQNFRITDCTLAEQIHQQVLSLPMDPTMSDEAVTKVIDAVNGFKA